VSDNKYGVRMTEVARRIRSKEAACCLNVMATNDKEGKSRILVLFFRRH